MEEEVDMEEEVEEDSEDSDDSETTSVFAVLGIRRGKTPSQHRFKIQYSDQTVSWAGIDTLIDPDGTTMLIRSTGRPFCLEDPSTWEWKGYADHPPVSYALDQPRLCSHHDIAAAKKYVQRTGISPSDPIGFEMVKAYREQIQKDDGIFEKLLLERLPSLSRAFDERNCIYRVQGIYPSGRAYSVLINDRVIEFDDGVYRTNHLHVALFVFATLAKLDPEQYLTDEEYRDFCVV